MHSFDDHTDWCHGLAWQPALPQPEPQPEPQGNKQEEAVLASCSADGICVVYRLFKTERRPEGHMDQEIRRVCSLLIDHLME